MFPWVNSADYFGYLVSDERRQQNFVSRNDQQNNNASNNYQNANRLQGRQGGRVVNYLSNGNSANYQWNGYHSSDCSNGNSSIAIHQQEQPLVAMTTSQPRNTSEFQLYKVLQRANLLQYYDTFIAQGGDDVQQLCEAGEEEFLEIMALVGMASKPLHVRRLQKALQEWVANPAGFQSSVSASAVMSLLTSNPVPATTASLPTVISSVTRQEPAPAAYTVQTTTNGNSSSWLQDLPTNQRSVSPGPLSTSGSGTSIQDDSKDGEKKTSSPPLSTPMLADSQISAIAEAASKLAKELPPFDAKRLNMKKPINVEIMSVIQATENAADDPNHLELLRKYAAIYGRFDSKRKLDKPMSLHEISVNEAAAQLCRHMPTLLTRREDLFPLARQVVRDSGYQYSKGHSRSKPRLDMGFIQMYMNLCESNPSMMKSMVDSDKMTTLSQELTIATQKQEELKTQIQAAKDGGQEDLVQSLTTELEQAAAKQLQLYTEQSELIRKSRRFVSYLRLSVAFGNSSPTNSGDGEDFNQQVRQHLYSSLAAHNKAGLHMQNTLFDEGLRIAQQYGMADFAEELKGLQDDDNSVDNSTESDSKSQVLSQTAADRKNSDHTSEASSRNARESFGFTPVTDRGNSDHSNEASSRNTRESFEFIPNEMNGVMNMKTEPRDEEDS
ncbi:hypothetical protein FSP39_023686 [Pinctada imbricata]|uniref:NGFI-A-binding protein homolog n=1 Tax=Pinctada imbricata TaxID=66713 RepID=A0AA88YJA2_PINIB|nr:hypothetical protein FSP39_023686 [Pinctada imbricata]